ncbi:MAG TPA: TetR/AcrR family transcriptional regulator, partial [Steroidobacteraceae bacterium]|nr:TetR/AcrR family transcriptional regulator [Steroidobacteraceae bacterium]
SFVLLPIMPPHSAARAAPRAHNRLSQILDEAAKLFREKGFQATSVRDIVRAVDMLPGSLYYHFAAKEDLLVAVYAEGVRRISDSVTRAVECRTDPWERLEAACIGHLEALLQESDYAQVVIRVRPSDAMSVADELIKLRDEYEKIFNDLIAALPLARGVDRRSLKLMLMGALNWSQTWYQPGRTTPAAIAKRFVALLKEPLVKD